jgi:predicted transcriptional regulator
MNEAPRENGDQGIYIKLATDIVSAYVGNNEVERGDLPDLIRNVHTSLQSLNNANAITARSKPAVSIKKSLTDEFIICLEDGKKFKSLKRHLRSKYNMSPEDYRAKWGLPADYPMVAPGYSRQRSQLAKDMGLGKG